MKISTVSEMRELDQIAIRRFGIRAELLMENAGHAAYTVLSNQFDIEERRCVVLCGAGNNAGDGFVLARKIRSNGGDVNVFILGDLDRFRGAAKMNLDILTRMPVKITRLESIESLSAELDGFDVVADAIFGTGLTRTVQGLHREVIEVLNESGKPVLSIDIPSGIHGDTGQVMGAAVRATCTVTFGLPKIGSLLFPGYEFCGRLYVSHISFPPSLYDGQSLRIEVNSPATWRPAPDWKDRGGALFVGADPNTFAASHLAALTFLRVSGANAFLALPESVGAGIAGKETGVVVVPQKATNSGCISPSNRSSLLQLAATTDLVILGPGLPADEKTLRLQQELVRTIEKPLILYGDWLAAIPGYVESVFQRKAGTVLVSTLSQMSRITGETLSYLEKNRIDVLQRTAKELNAVIVLEGFHSLVGCPDRRVYLNLSGGGSLTRAGSSDVLAGAVASMFSPRLPLNEVVRTGVFAHGFAVDLSVKHNRQSELTARAILESLPAALEIGWADVDEPLRNRYAGGVRVS